MRRHSLLVVFAALILACSGRNTPTGSSTNPTPTSPSPSPSPSPAPDPAPSPTCAYALTATPDDFERDGGNGTLAIATTASCKWAVKSDAAWAVIEDVQQGEGPARLKVYAQPNEGADARRLTFTVGDQSVAITQPGQGDCVYQVTPVNDTIPRLAWQGQITISTTPGCSWKTSSDASWLHLQQTEGRNSATISYSADFNPANQYGDRRTALLAFRWAAPTAGQNVRVTQTGDCNLGMSPATGGLPAGATFSGGFNGGTLTATAAGGQVHFWILVEPVFAGCAWDVESSDSWVDFQSPRVRQVMASDGDLHFGLPPNSSSQPRQARLVMDGRVLTVVQQGR